MARRTPEATEETRKAIVDAARFLFGTRGFAETKISDICARINLTKGALFHHFKSKEALFEEIWMDMEVSMDTAAAHKTLEVLNETLDPYIAFIAGCRIYVDHVSRREFQQIVYIDGPVIIGMEKWMEQDANMGMRNIGSGLKLLSKVGMIKEESRYALTVLTYGALQSIAKTLSFQSITSRTNSDELFSAFENLILAAKDI